MLRLASKTKFDEQTREKKMNEKELSMLQVRKGQIR